jgi:hypothetical protein
MEPMHEDYDLKQEQLNKSSLLSSERFLDGLLDMWTTHVVRKIMRTKIEMIFSGLFRTKIKDPIHLVYFMDILSYFVVILVYMYFPFWCVAPRKIWQP